ncbi:RipA family octameric membrane protein [Clostridium sp. CAG:43]|uniref:RipA family octameric membrane protein n=1 Tax=Clostridium sp. CAG:43 TaxID=1262805 RepID=UPI000340757C|nr:hypothetical protein [Clostridium sp. CAG:43]CDD58350.1 small integral membrane protein [Clostridium sp. CAG:43]
MELYNDINDDGKELILEQYKLYVEMADKVSERRFNVNTFFLTANSTILTVITIKGFDVVKFSWIITAVGIVLSYTWYYLLQSYKLLNSGKFEVIHKVEQHLPLNLYVFEWEVLGEGKERAKYWPISHIEKILPVLFGIIYIIFEIVILIGGID